VAFGIPGSGEARVVLGVNPKLERIDMGSLDEHSFRVYAEIGDDRFPGAVARLRLQPANIIPIAPKLGDGQSYFTEAEEIEGPEAPGALLVLDRKTQAMLYERNALVWVEIDGDHVQGRAGAEKPLRAIDAEFLRSRLPTGDRPEAATRGVQGGLFSSWINRADPEGLKSGRLDLNLVSEVVLTRLGLTAAAAKKVIAARDAQGGFASLDQVNSVTGLGAAAKKSLAASGLFVLGAS